MTTTSKVPFTWNDAKVEFAKAFPGYAARPHQDALAEQAWEALFENNHLLAQAGCGTGKSFVLILVAAVYAHVTGETVLLSTATKSLQDQYATKDMPFLAENVYPFTYAVLKGRSNFVCNAKLADLSSPVASTLRTELETEGHTGEFDTLSTPVDFKDRAALTTSSDECPGKSECPFGKVCFAEKAKAKAAGSDVVVVNHASLAIDTKIKATQRDMGMPEERVTGMLPRYSAVVVDEGHELEEYVRNGLSVELTERNVNRFGTAFADLAGKDGQAHVKALSSATVKLFDALRVEFNADRSRSSSVAISVQALGRLSGDMLAINTALLSMESFADGMLVHGDDKLGQKRKRFLKSVANMQNKINEILVSGADDLVRWIELDERRGAVLKTSPLHVGDFLAVEIWERVPAVIASATLSNAGDFTFTATGLGLA